MSMAHSEDKQPIAARDTTVAPRDWFMPAIETDGSVSECLTSVLDDLALRSDFIYALKTSVGGIDGTGVDSITRLGKNLKALDNTLRFRLGILRPERTGAWFKKPVATSTGPFASSILSEPVFYAYDASQTSAISKSLLKCWQEKSFEHYPFGENECLWRSLIQAKIDWHAIVKLPEPFTNFRLDSLPTDLPPELSSPSLRAFLTNVRRELKTLKAKTDNCYSQLFKSSQGFWRHQRELAAKGHDNWQTEKQNIHKQQAEQTKAHFKKRRETATRPNLRTSADLQALRYLGFDSFPTIETLRQRYLLMAKRLHPDRLGGNEDAFKMLTKSYKHLSTYTGITT